LDSQSHVEHDATVCRAPHRVEVGLDDLGDLPEQQSEAQDQLAQRRTIERSRAPKPVQLSGDARAGVDQPVGLDVCCRRQAERNRFAKAG
jgi:hypothetical protein